MYREFKADGPEPEYPPCHVCRKPTSMFTPIEGYGNASIAFCSERCRYLWKKNASGIGGSSGLKDTNKDRSEPKK